MPITISPSVSVTNLAQCVAGDVVIVDNRIGIVCALPNDPLKRSALAVRDPAAGVFEYHFSDGGKSLLRVERDATLQPIIASANAPSAPGRTSGGTLFLGAVAPFLVVVMPNSQEWRVLDFDQWALRTATGGHFPSIAKWRLGIPTVSGEWEWLIEVG